MKRQTAILRSFDLYADIKGGAAPIARKPSSALHPLPAAESPSLSDEEFSLLSDLIYRNSGIKLNVLKKGLLIARLSKRIRHLRARGFYDYYHRVKDDAAEMTEMLNCISTNITEFFRESHHFEYLQNSIMPELLGNKTGREMRIWSAGCSTGEEPYSIAMTLLEGLRARNLDPTLYNIIILATDISTTALERAREGVYDLDQLPHNLRQDAVRRYFLVGEKENAGKIKIKDQLKEMVTFGRLNLRDPQYPFKKSFDAIFCRNVMIYFDEHMKRHVMSNFNRYLSEGGHLFLGHAETMAGREEFKSVHTTVYRKVS